MFTRLACCRHASTPRTPLQAFLGKRSLSTSQVHGATWGFVGLGQMGFRMAKNLRHKMPSNNELIIHDINQGACKALLEDLPGLKVKIAQNAREVAEASEIVITALPEPSHVSSVYRSMIESSTAKVGTAAKQQLFVDCSTIDPMTSAEVAKLVQSTGEKCFIDAPMSGGVVGAEAGTLTFMIGAPKELVVRATEILSMMGKRVLHMGDPGSGLKAKLANNYLLALNNIATCEAMNMGIKWGLDPAALANMINISTGRCWPSEVNNPVPGVAAGAPASRDYEGGFGVALMNKDLKLALKAAEEFNVKVELGGMAQAVYDKVQNNAAYKGKDFSVVYKYLSKDE